jgi:hypothetical protein
MRIFNGTNFNLDIPYTGSLRISIPPKSASKELILTNDTMQLVLGTFSSKEVALIVNSKYEASAYSDCPTLVNYVVESLEEAVSRFYEAPKEQSLTDEKLLKEAEENNVKEAEPTITVEKEEEAVNDVEVNEAVSVSEVPASTEEVEVKAEEELVEEKIEEPVVKKSRGRKKIAAENE